MIIPGLVSVTFRDRPPVEVVAMAREAGLQAIEWSGDAHLPRGDTARARELAALCADAEIAIAGFGSYYRLCHSEEDGYPFDVALADASAMGAPAIRVWAGARASADADDAYRDAVARESHRIADLSAARHIRVAYEFHAETLTDTDESALALLQSVNHPNLGTLWQPHNGIEPETNLTGLRRLLPYVDYLHVFHWWPTHHDRLPLADGKASWIPYLQTASSTGHHLYALLEFVPNDCPDALHRDAATLQAWCSRMA